MSHRLRIESFRLVCSGHSVTCYISGDLIGCKKSAEDRTKIIATYGRSQDALALAKR